MRVRARDCAVSNPFLDDHTSGLPALPKIHHSWPLALNFTDPAVRPVLEDYARITHAVGVGALVRGSLRLCLGVSASLPLGLSHTRLNGASDLDVHARGCRRGGGSRG